MSKENNLINASLTEFGDPNYKIIPGYEFTTEEVDGKILLLIKRPDKGYLLPYPELGDDHKALGITKLDGNGDLLTSKGKVLHGVNLHPHWSAKRSVGKKFKVTDPNGNVTVATMGEFFPAIGSVLESKDDSKNLSFNGGKLSVKVFYKTKTVQLMVMNEDVGRGKSAYINTILPGNKNNSKDGVKGVFHKSNGNMPAYFSTKYSGIDVATAIFEVNKDTNKASIQIFSVDDAFKMKTIKLRLISISKESSKFDMDPADNQEYVNLHCKLKQMRGNVKKLDFDINKGHYLFDLKYSSRGKANSQYTSNQSRHYNSSNAPSR